MILNRKIMKIIPEGFKQTEIGVIPEDWDVKKLANVASLKARIGWQGLTTAEYKDSGEYYLITGTDFKNGFIDWENCHYVEKDRYNQDKNIQIKKHDVLITKDGTIGKVALVNAISKPATLNSGVFVIRPIKNKFYPEYFYYLLLSEVFLRFLAQLSAGSTINHLYQKDFINFLFQTPSKIQEQKAIATGLSDTDALIEKLEKLIAKKKAIKQGSMQQLLTGKKRLQGFSGEWKVKSIEEICIKNGLVRGPFGGALKKEFFVPKGYKVYEQRNAIYCDVTLGTYYINKSKYEELKRFEVKKRDFIISCSGTIGKIYQIPENFEKGVINQALLKITINSNLFSDQYFKHYFKWEEFQQRIIENTQGGAMKNLIGMIEFRRTPIVFPPTKSEQTAIATVLSDMDTEIIKLEQKRDKYIMLKQGIMQQLLTGRIRIYDHK